MNVVYNYYNPVHQRSRSRETLTAVHLQSAALRARLANSDIPSGLSGYLSAELEAELSRSLVIKPGIAQLLVANLFRHICN